MEHAIGMYLTKSICHLTDVGYCSCLGKRTAIIDKRFKVATIKILHYIVCCTILFKDIDY